MQAAGKGRYIRKAKQDLIEQVRTAFREGDAKEGRPASRWP
jgi:hypothetical protein